MQQFQKLKEHINYLYQDDVTQTQRRVIFTHIDYLLGKLDSRITQLPLRQTGPPELAPLPLPVSLPLRRQVPPRLQLNDPFLQIIRSIKTPDPEKEQPNKRNNGRLLMGRLYRNASVLPKHVRLDPLRQSRPVLASQLAEGVSPLMNRGVINQFVNYDAAFEQVRPVFRSIKLSRLRTDPIRIKNKPMESAIINEDKAGALTQSQNQAECTDSLLNILEDYKMQLNKLSNQNSSSIQVLPQVQAREQSKMLVIQFKNGKPVADSALLQLRHKYADDWGAVKVSLREVQKFSKRLKVNSLSIRIQEVLTWDTQLKGIRKADLMRAIVLPTLVKKADLQQNFQARRAQAVETIKNSLRSMLNRQGIKRLSTKGMPNVLNRVKAYCQIFKLKGRIRRSKRMKESKADQLMEQLRQDWSGRERPVEVHVPSYSMTDWQRLTCESVKSYEFQLGRVVREGADVVLVLPSLSRELTDGVHRLLNQVQHTLRPTLVIPENGDKFPPQISLARLLYYSRKALNRIKAACKGRLAYIVPGKLPLLADYIHLSTFLGIPLYCPRLPLLRELQDHVAVRQTLAESKSPVLPCEAVAAGCGLEGLFKHLTLMVMTFRQFSVWLFKIRGERMGRGCAVLDFSGIRNLQKILAAQTYSEEDLHQVFLIVSSFLQLKLQPSSEHLYRTEDFIATLLEQGGTIQPLPAKAACFKVCYELKPDGQLCYSGCVEAIQVKGCLTQGYRVAGLPWLKTGLLAEPVAELLRSRSSFGFFTISIVLSETSFWCTEVTPEFTTSHSVLDLAASLQASASAPRQLFVAPHVYHPGLHSFRVKDFLERLPEFEYNQETRTGVMILLAAQEQASTMWVISVGSERREIEQAAMEVLFGIVNCCGSVVLSEQGFRHDSRNINSIAVRLRQRLKREEI